MKKLVPHVIVALMFCGTMSLGIWQIQRMQWKEALLAKLNERVNAAPISETQISNPEDDEFKQIELLGSYDHSKELQVLHQSLNGKVGVHVLTPFTTQTGSVFLINRGWVLYEEKFDKPEGEQKILGVIRKDPRQGHFALENEPQKNIWYNLNLQQMYAKISAPELGFYIEDKATDGEDTKYPIALPKEIRIYNEHMQYVLTWFGISLALLVVYYFRFWHKKKELGKLQK